MDTCFPLLKLKHHCVRATGERNQPTERRERRERSARERREPLLELTEPRRLREEREPWGRNSPSRVLSWVPPAPEKGLNKAGFTSFHTSLGEQGIIKPFRADGERKTLISELGSFGEGTEKYFSRNCLHFRSRVSERKGGKKKKERKSLPGWEPAKQKSSCCSTLRCRFCCPTLALKFVVIVSPTFWTRWF